MIPDARDLRVGDVVDRVRGAGVFGDGVAGVVDDAVILVIDDVFEDRAEPDGVEDFGLFLRRKIDALGVASPFDVEDARVRPAMLVVADQSTM